MNDDKPTYLDRAILFFCRNCSQLVDVTRIQKKYLYKCKNCGSEDVTFGSAKSVKNFFHLKGDGTPE